MNEFSYEIEGFALFCSFFLSFLSFFFSFFLSSCWFASVACLCGLSLCCVLFHIPSSPPCLLLLARLLCLLAFLDLVASLLFFPLVRLLCLLPWWLSVGFFPSLLFLSSRSLACLWYVSVHCALSYRLEVTPRHSRNGSTPS
jgi:hypothetical protein